MWDVLEIEAVEGTIPISYFLEYSAFKKPRI
jgi:hypothetical protein